MFWCKKWHIFITLQLLHAWILTMTSITELLHMIALLVRIIMRIDPMLHMGVTLVITMMRMLPEHVWALHNPEPGQPSTQMAILVNVSQLGSFCHPDQTDLSVNWKYFHTFKKSNTSSTCSQLHSLFIFYVVLYLIVLCFNLIPLVFSISPLCRILQTPIVEIIHVSCLCVNRMI